MLKKAVRWAIRPASRRIGLRVRSLIDARCEALDSRLWALESHEAPPVEPIGRVSGGVNMAAGILPLIDQKWLSDSKSLPLSDRHKDLYDIIHAFYYAHLNHFPDIIGCRSFNEKMQWLKLFDQRRSTVSCSDKILFKDYVRDRLGDGYVPRTIQAADSFDQLDIGSAPDQFVIKTNHDSQSVVLVHDRSALNLETVKNRFDLALSKPYGWEFGEWAYRHIKPKVFLEEMLPISRPENPPDYKFYCVDGQVRFVHFLYDRSVGLKEQTVDVDGRDMNVPFYPGASYGDAFVKPQTWKAMISAAEKLSQGWKFVRVDLYSILERIYAGEMTFWPGAGLYSGAGQEALGSLLEFDRSTTLPFIANKLPIAPQWA